MLSTIMISLTMYMVNYNDFRSSNRGVVAYNLYKTLSQDPEIRRIYDNIRDVTTSRGRYR